MTSDVSTAVVLAAGEGQRLAPLTNRRPKPMIPVVNRPLLAHVIEAIAATDIDRVVLVVGYQRDRIQTYFGDGDDWGIDIEYAIQTPQLGTAHALEQARSHVEAPFLVLNGDRIIEPAAVKSIANRIEDPDVTTAMSVTRVEHPSAYGVVTLSGERVTGIIEKPREEPSSEFINAGVYGFDASIFEVIDDLEDRPGGERRLPDAIGSQLDATITAVPYDGRWLDVSYLWDLLSVTGAMLDTEGGAAAGHLGPGAQVSDAAHLDATASVGAAAVVGRGTTVGANARIESNATVERSVVMHDATVESGAVLRDCIVGANATVGPNATVPGGEATVIVDEEVHRSVPLGGVIGDNATVGGAVLLDPGTILGDGVQVAGGSRVTGRIPPGTEVTR